MIKKNFLFLYITYTILGILLLLDEITTRIGLKSVCIEESNLFAINYFNLYLCMKILAFVSLGIIILYARLSEDLNNEKYLNWLLKIVVFIISGIILLYIRVVSNNLFLIIKGC